MTHEQGRGLPPSCGGRGRPAAGGGRGRPAAAAGHSWSLPTASHPSSLRVCAWRSPPRGGAVRLRGRPAWRSEWSPCRQHWGGWVTGSLESPAQILPTPCPSSPFPRSSFLDICFCEAWGLTPSKNGGPLPGPESGLLSHTQKRPVQGDTCPQGKRLYWEGRPGGGQQVRGPRRTALPRGSQSQV